MDKLKHQCPYCSSKFQVINSLNGHVKSKHPGMKYSSTASMTETKIKDDAELEELMLVKKLRDGELTLKEFKQSLFERYVSVLIPPTGSPVSEYVIRNKIVGSQDVYLFKKAPRWESNRWPSSKGKYLRTETYNNGAAVKLNVNEGFCNIRVSDPVQIKTIHVCTTEPIFRLTSRFNDFNNALPAFISIWGNDDAKHNIMNGHNTKINMYADSELPAIMRLTLEKNFTYTVDIVKYEKPPTEVIEIVCAEKHTDSLISTDCRFNIDKFNHPTKTLKAMFETPPGQNVEIESVALEIVNTKTGDKLMLPFVYSDDMYILDLPITKDKNVETYTELLNLTRIKPETGFTVEIVCTVTGNRNTPIIMHIEQTNMNVVRFFSGMYGMAYT